MRGDLLFWPSDGSFVSRAIAAATAGPYVHVSIDMGDGTDIGAHPTGILQHSLPNVTGLTRFRPAVAPAALERGCVFVRGELGDRYGWSNILDAVLALLRLPYRVVRLDAYDCSSLATRYLAIMGLDLGDLAEEPDSVSPNDLARKLGVAP